MSKVRDNYNENYFNWYERIGKFYGIFNDKISDIVAVAKKTN